MRLGTGSAGKDDGRDKRIPLLYAAALSYDFLPMVMVKNRHDRPTVTDWRQ
jgi:hypothetical protein